MLDALEVFERLETARALVRRLARRRTELADTLRLRGRAPRALNRRIGPQAARTVDRVRGRRDAVLAQFLACAVGEPVAAPRRSQHRVDPHLRETRLLQ